MPDDLWRNIHELSLCIEGGSRGERDWNLQRLPPIARAKTMRELQFVINELIRFEPTLPTGDQRQLANTF